MNSYVFNAENETDTDRLAAALADVLPAGTTVALLGTLGAGKTRLVQAMSVAYGLPRGEVVSPTFVLCQEYHGSKTLYHLDAYRLHDEDELMELGVEEYFDSDGITLIEWADRVSDCLPIDRLEIQIEVTGDTQRRFTISAVGEPLQKVVEALQSQLESR